MLNGTAGKHNPRLSQMLSVLVAILDGRRPSVFSTRRQRETRK
jgi:hypothetical protein